MNYLTSWYENMRLFKWTQVLRDHPYLKNLDALKEELDGFFPSTDFDTTQKLNPHNWILFLCADNQPNSIYILNEIAELIRYYNYLGQPESYHIKNKEGAIDYSHLQEWLFEIQVHYLLSGIGMSPGNSNDVDTGRFKGTSTITHRFTGYRSCYILREKAF